MRTRRFRSQSGQALTEFVVVGVFVLVPLFVLIPVVAQLISQKQDVELGARYAAWERTAWNQSGGSGPSKSDARIAGEIDRRIFARDEQPIVSDAHDSFELDPFSQRANGAQEALVEKNTSRGTYAVVNHEQAAPGTGLAGVLTGLISAVSGLVGNFGGGTSGFDLNQRGLYDAEVTVPVIDLTDTFDVPGVDMSGMRLSAHNALLTESWAARGTEDAQDNIRGLMPITLLNNPVLDTARSALSVLPFARELDPDCLDFGRVDLAPVPYGRIGPRAGAYGDSGLPHCNL